MKAYRSTHLVVAAAATVLLLAACSNSKEANTSNFEAAVTDGLKSGPSMCVSVALDWPDSAPDSSDRAQVRRPLVEAGLLSATPVSVANAVGAPVPGHKYDLTAEGKNYANRGALCYGKPHLQKLLDWDPVQTVLGVPQTMAHFTYTIDDLPEWAKRPDVQAALPNMRNVIDGQNKNRMQMPLMLDGDHWRSALVNRS
ncbi:hypothetical protein [Paraburkholderia terrae]|uniref:hypothetical protein n=1 Tax=Paraburkholderia terrae TaxID=311230 RepID=UPI001EE2534F|nr:hypothetical protein [Paraburkholderia terrae]GJH04572.1 hypothetical protein CBA19C8_28465 [Paraburkholderia terrae]